MRTVEEVKELLEKSSVICRCNNLAVLVVKDGQVPLILAVIMDQNDAILATTELDLAMASFLLKSLDVTINQVLGQYVLENLNGEKENESGS